MNKKIIFGGVLFFMVFFALFPYIKADVLSVNSGGNLTLAITPDKYIEGFFFQIQKQVTPVTPPSTGGGTSGGGGGATVSPLNIQVNPTEFNINLAINTNVQKTVSVTNLGSTNATVNISQTNLEGMVILGSNSLTIGPGETKTFFVTFVASNETGSYAGIIHVGNKEVLVSINVKSEILLFDSSIIVLNPSSVVAQGEDLKTRVTLVPMASSVREDVTLNYAIKDYEGKVYFTKSETTLVDSLKTFDRDFSVANIPSGKYIVTLRLVYSNGIAPSSAQFQIAGRTAAQRAFGFILFYLVIAILIASIFLIIIMISRTVKRILLQRAAQKNYGQRVKSNI